MYDHCKVLRVTGDTDAALPKHTKVHKIQVINGTTSATASMKLHDAATVTGNPVAEVHSEEVTDGGASLFATSTSEDFPRPLFFEVGVSIDMTGTNAVGYVFYTL